MKPLYKYAAIDIGSNAVRLLLAGVSSLYTEKKPKKISWVRMPIRLGEDAFTRGRISKENIQRFEHTLTGFSHLIRAFNPLGTMACATSAMRTAQNGPHICRKTEELTGIPIRIIDGKQEADILFQSFKTDLAAGDRPCLFIDVGGGSTEITLFSKGQVAAARSFDMGTIRLLNNLAREQVWEDMHQWLKRHTKGFDKIRAVGSGGNINKLFRLADGKTGKPVSLDKIKQVSRSLKHLTPDQRITQFNLRPDRADVIVPAARIYLRAMEWSGCRKIQVPMRGLADGMVNILHAHEQPH